MSIAVTDRSAQTIFSACASPSLKCAGSPRMPSNEGVQASVRILQFSGSTYVVAAVHHVNVPYASAMAACFDLGRSWCFSSLEWPQ
jgi:hypothetical protein